MRVLRLLLVGVVSSLAPSAALAQQVIAEIHVPAMPPEIMALNEVTHRVYAIGDGESGPRVLSAVDMTSHTCCKSIDVPSIQRRLR